MANNFRKNYYEILDVSAGSTLDEIETAYKSRRKLYDENVAALYSLYAPDERKAALEDIDEAYSTLGDPAKKREYDACLSKTEKGPGSYEVDINALFTGDVLKGSFAAHGPSGQIGEVKLKEPLPVVNSRHPAATEQYRVLYSNLEKICAGGSHMSLAITSAVKGEGKTITSLNLSYIMAKEFKKRVALVECDLRKPSTLIDYIDKADRRGLADVLRGEASLQSVISRLSDTELYLITSGAGDTTAASELLGTQMFKSAINTLKAEFDYVIVDSPPVLPFVDMNLISRIVDGLLVVVRAGKAPKDMVIKAVGSLPPDLVAGVILNGAEVAYKSYYY